MRVGLPKAESKTLTNADLARLLDERADELGAEGANVYRIRAYNRAARNLESYPRDVAAMVKAGEDLRQIPGIGQDLAAKLRALVEGGGASLPPLERPPRPRARDPAKKVPGRLPSDQRRIRPLVLTVEARIRRALAAAPGVTRVEPAGSFRRLSDTLGDLDFLIAGPLEAARKALEDHPEVDGIVEDKGNVLTVRLTKGMHVDVRNAEPQAFGAAWILSTGTRKHNEDLARHAEKKGFHLRDDGLFKARKRVDCATEAEVYAHLQLQDIPPELREGHGEVEAASKGRLPELVTAADLRGDLHTHTVDSDGANTLETMARAAIKRGLSYIAVTDHTSRTAIANGMLWDGFLRQHKLIDKLNGTFEDEGLSFRVLKGAEVDILKDGSLDLAPKELDQLDVVVASLHFRERQTGKEHTDRVLRAMGTGKADVLGHPSGRLLGRRPPMDHDWPRLIDAAKDQGWAFEVDGSPWRQDVWAELVLLGKEAGIRFALDSDAHSTHELGYQVHALEQGRRGWLEKGDVLNTRTAKQLLKLLG
jgi:DNA polymerase (family X)